MNSSNPFVAPTADHDYSNSAREFDFGKIMKRWERLRIVYNAVLIPWVLLLLFFTSAPPAIIVLIPFAGLLANFLYLVGPAVESYMTWFGAWNFAMTIVAFLTGLATTAAVAAAAILQLV